MNARYDNILETIGNTPVIRINRLAPPGINMFVKAEAFNPMGSVKDRMALSVIEDAERSGALKPGQTVIEATSGNTGIGLAMVCAVRGYPLVVTMAENFSIERRKILRHLGARVVLTPAALKGTGMMAKARELAEAHGWFLVSQFDNEANADAHVRTTAEEILAAFHDTPLHAFVTGYGTGGTLKGVSRVLRHRSPGTRIAVCEPDNSPLLGSGISQSRDALGRPTDSHPSFRPHLMQGWTPDFIPVLAEDAVELGLFDEVVPVNGNDAMHFARELARQEGIFVGTSGGATFAGAMRLAGSAPHGSNILCMLPDTGERYLSTPLFAEVHADMNDEELAISRSTPNFRFDAAAPAPAPSDDAVNAGEDAEAEAQVKGILHDADQPVVLFALEWCEFSWSVRKLFAAMDVPFRSVDLDSVAYQRDDLGGRYRKVLKELTGAPTIPQAFIGGHHVGGCTEVFEAYSDGRLDALLESNGIRASDGPKLDPASLFPTWSQARLRRSA